MAKTVAHQIAETLGAAGVKRVYGIVGDSLNGLTDALCRPATLRPWTAPHRPAFAAFARLQSACSIVTLVVASSPRMRC